MVSVTYRNLYRVLVYIFVNWFLFKRLAKEEDEMAEGADQADTSNTKKKKRKKSSKSHKEKK